MIYGFLPFIGDLPRCDQCELSLGQTGDGTWIFVSSASRPNRGLAGMVDCALNSVICLLSPILSVYFFVFISLFIYFCGWFTFKSVIDYSVSPDIILWGCMGSKHQLTDLD